MRKQSARLSEERGDEETSRPGPSNPKSRTVKSRDFEQDEAGEDRQVARALEVKVFEVCLSQEYFQNDQSLSARNLRWPEHQPFSCFGDWFFRHCASVRGNGS